jgi:2-polyprenyl-6-methoxyphenol hydroxylase-like FAD-dependent oxidoreductase
MHVLISGAGIAGGALAFWLRRYGFEVTVLERAEALRDYGQNVDVRGAGREVVRRMGLEQRIKQKRTGEVGTRFVDQNGCTVAEFPAGVGDSDGATAELEILRGELVRLLVDDSSGYVYGDAISGLEQSEREVRVTFERGQQRRYDFVVLAEGIGSHTRRLVFGDVQVRDLGQYTAFGTIARTRDDDDWWRWCSPARGRAMMLRPDNLGTTRAMLAFLSAPRGYEDLDRASQIEVLNRNFADAGWQARRILDGFAQGTSELYMQRTAQVYASTWSKGRVVMVGDAAYCASPISGMGTSLALTGAYVLAGELARSKGDPSALAAYEALLRPYVAKAQKLPPGAPRLANPMTALGVHTLRTFLRIVASKPMRALGSKLFTPPADAFRLPDYGSTTPARVAQPAAERSDPAFRS